MRVPVVLDCDPGHDDALAIMLAAADPPIDLLAITTVAGNQTLQKTTLNARRVASLAGLTGLPVAAGCDRPLRGPLRIAQDVHGESGLDGPSFGEPTVPEHGEHAVALTRRILLDHPEPVTPVPTGPLTNIATLLRDHPEVAPRIREIVFMGGSTERGNITPYAEFNVFVHDPIAMARVIAPEVVRCVRAPVVVELEGEHTRGATLVDLHRRTGRPADVEVATELDVPAFWDLVIGAVAALGRIP